ncbi:DNA topoisomerase 3 [Methylotuvimicrobium sp. KM1]|uniref:DNA topoisomerase III n=1 Tax=Methylotuvimicrobium sp. KM1 TaxID=3377707 RepID=UPI00384ECDE7
MTALYLCEKPSQAKDIARVLGANQRRDGYFEGPQTIVTWCFGHLLEMAAPEDYDPELKTWRFETLPIIPGQWVWKVRKDANKQYRVIVGLFKQADEIVISTDADREGESIAREVMDRGGWKGPVSRLWLSALDDQSIRKALANRLPGERTAALYAAAVSRSKADWLVGMSLSRLYTLSARQSGYDGGVMSVGRVQTPTLKLVVDRDRAIENFKPLPYYDVMATFQTRDRNSFTGHWQVPDDLSDDEGRCLNRAAAQVVADRCRGKTAVISSVATKRVKESAPLPYSLSALQQEASHRFGMGAQQVLDIAQALYETHKLTTYPRTDCDYLPQAQYESASAIIEVMKGDDEFRSIAECADPSIRSKAWNDNKITAHHAISPTGVKRNRALNTNESLLFGLIVRRYLAQFYPDHEYDQTTMDLSVGEDRFKSTGKRIIKAGWKLALLRNDQQDTNDKETVLPKLSKGDELSVADCRVDDKETQPPARYTEGTLIQAMKNVGKFVEHPVLKKRLKETSGIGTEATRASIIDLLLKRGFIDKQKKKYLVSSDKARSLIDALPEPVKDPATTAVWEQALEDIAQGNGNPDRFVDDQAKMVTHWVEKVRQGMPSQFKEWAANTLAYECPECGHPLVRRNGKKGFFWGCRQYPECKVVLPDEHGKPGKQREKAKSTGQSCPECGEGDLVQRTVRNGKAKGQSFIGCSRYPECSYTEG